jgi:hypothetical protein
MLPSDFDHWKTDYPDVPIGVRITDLQDNSCTVTRGKKKQVMGVSPSGDTVIFDSQYDLKKQLGVMTYNLHDAIRKGRKVHGWTFSFI